MTTAAEELIHQGIERGIRQGEVEGERKVLLRLLRQRFGRLDNTTERHIAAATSEQLETWTLRVLSAETLTEVLAG